MKTTRKKIILGLGLALCGTFAKAQVGLEGIIVEKYYVANAADAANASNNGSLVPLVAGQSVTYRVYVDMATGWKFSLLKGNANHPLKITTSTAFYSDPSNGVEIGAQGISAANSKKNTVLIDTWLTAGGVSAGKVAVVEAEDTDGSNGNTQGILQNNPGGVYGLPINIGTTVNAGAKDGLIAGTAAVPTTLGFGGAGTPSEIFQDAVGGSFIVTNGAMSILGGGLGFGPNNKMLIGQFTTDGVFGFELNVQLINPSGTAVEYVANNPQAGETVINGLTLAPNTPPTVNIGGPSNVITGNVATYTATASDADGTVTGVQFKVDGVNFGSVQAGPTYSINWTSVVGTHTISATATDDDLDASTATTIVNVANNQAPTATVIATPTAVVGDIVAATVNAGDVDGTVASVEFFVDNVSFGIDNSAPFSFNWSAVVGAHTFKARATDNLGLVGPFSAIANISVANNNPPTAAITAPLNNSSYLAPAVVSITATATDDESVAQVVLFVDAVPTATVAGAGPYVFSYTTSTLAIGSRVLTVRSTDNRGASTLSSPVTIIVTDPNALPYEVVSTKQTCLPTTFCIPVAAAATYTVNDVIGYDVVLNYDPNKITPTGNITVYNDLITSSYVETANTFTNGTMNIAAYFSASAPANAEFNGTGKLFCVEFTKTANFASVDTAVVSVSSLQESYYTGIAPKLVSSGKFTTYKDTTFTGALKFWSDGQPIKYDVAQPNNYLITNVYGTSSVCATNTAVAVQPNLTGNFTYNLINGQSINIDRDILNSTSVFFAVTANDAFIGKRVALSNPSQTLSVFQAIALDVNIDGVISAGDVSQIQQRNVLVIPEFRQAWNYNNAGVSNGQKSKDWVFVDSLRLQNNPAYQVSSTFPADNGTGFSKSRVPVTPFCLPVTVSNYANCPLITSETYKGIMLGDADGNYANLTNDGLIKRESANGDKVIFDLSNAIVNGNTVDVPVSFESSESVHAINFAFNFNEDKLTLNDVVKNTADSEMSSIYHLNENDRTLRFSAYTLNNFEAKQPVVSVRFETVNGSISAEDLKGTVGLLNGNQVHVAFKGALSVNKPVNNTVSIYPNPTAGLLNVVTSENATVQLMDISGQEVLLETTVNAYEKQEINVSDFANGIYIMKVSNNNSVTIKKIVLNK